MLRRVDLRTAPLPRTAELRGLLPHVAVDVEPSCLTESWFWAAAHRLRM